MSRQDLKNLETEIMQLTTLLIEHGISVNQEYTSIFQKNVSGESRHCIGIKKNNFDMSIMLNTHLEYKELHEQLDKSHIYNIKLLDGALVSLYYEFDKSYDLVKHRLTFFPSTTLFSLESKENEDVDMLEHIYADIINHNIYPTPIRFDYDPQASKIDHSPSHLTIGQYENCRIPVSNPVSPTNFFNFIFKNFYYNFYKIKIEKLLKDSKISCFKLNCLEENNLTKHHHLFI